MFFITLNFDQRKNAKKNDRPEPEKPSVKLVSKTKSDDKWTYTNMLKPSMAIVKHFLVEIVKNESAMTLP